ncbi:hypothetical protein B0H34DRAFT_533992 [Crassisporium funariophilum]|nr:hypothetical protein B0H34DRAFT_533992 [Crassisporium funariophilum]
MFSNANVIIQGGNFNNTGRGARRGFDKLHENIAPGALHDSGERFDPPKCHPNTRKAVIRSIMDWLQIEDEYFFMWLHGPAGAGKSAIVQTIAELCQSLGLLLASFFFSRNVDTRNNEKRLITTIAYQLALAIPNAREHIENVIENDPSVFERSLETQVESLVIQPLQLAFQAGALLPAQDRPRWPKLIIIDGLDECNDENIQVCILRVLSDCLVRTHNLPPLRILIASRPEHHLRNSFDTGNLNHFSSRLALDRSFRPDDDIRLFLRDKFTHIKQTHRFKHSIPKSWPRDDEVEFLVRKSSGQFIFASTVARYVASLHDDPVELLKVVSGLSSPRNEHESPYFELDKLYHHILGSSKDVSTALRILGFHIIEAQNHSDWGGTPLKCHESHLRTPKGQYWPHFGCTVESFLQLKKGELQYCLASLDSVLVEIYDEDHIRFLHASLSDFFLDRDRSGRFFIDLEIAHADAAVCCIQRKYGIEYDDRAQQHFLGINLAYHIKEASPTNKLRKELLSGNIFPVGAQLLSPILSSKFPDRQFLHIHVQQKVDRYFEAQISKYLIQPTASASSPLDSLILLAAGHFPLSSLLNLVPDAYDHPFWKGLILNLPPSGLFYTYNMNQRTTDAVEGLRDYLRDRRRSKEYYITRDMFAHMALRCLKSVKEHFLFLNQYLDDRDYHLGLLDYEPNKNQALPTMNIPPEDSTLDEITEIFLRFTVMPLMKEASPLQALLDVMKEPKVKVLLDVLDTTNDIELHRAFGVGEYRNEFKEYVRRCRSTPMNLFDLQPIMTSPDSSRLLRSLLEFALPQHLRYS